MSFDLSKIKYIDIHSHLHFPDFDSDREDVIERMKQEGIATIVIGTDIEQSKKARDLALGNANIFYSVGLHPHEDEDIIDLAFKDQDFYFKELKELAQNEKCICIGECGLDYFYISKEFSGTDLEEKKEKQKILFRRQIELARDLDLPLMLHVRPSEINGNREDAYLDAIQVLKEYLPPTPEGGETQIPTNENFDWTMTDKSKYGKLKELSIYLRNNKTVSEEIIWNRINNNQLGYHFRQQHIINNFIVDFVCLEKRLILEIDGKIHDFQKESDEERRKILESFGFKILRIKNQEILDNTDLVLSTIKSYLSKTESRSIIPPSGARGIKVNFHFFVSTKNVLEKILENKDWTVSIPAVCTFTEEYDEMIRVIPINRLHIETDSPYVVPKRRRKEAKRNEPSFVIDVFEKICEIKGVENKGEFEEALKENFKKMYLK